MGLPKLLTTVTSGRGQCDLGEGKDVCFLYTIPIYGLNFYEHKVYNLNKKKKIQLHLKLG